MVGVSVGPARASGEFWGVAAVFGVSVSPRQLENLEIFGRSVRRQGLPLVVAELAFGDAPHRVPDTVADRVLRFRSPDVLWHKERLLNLAVRALPPSCRFVAWLDADVVFENDEWVAATRDQLSTHTVVQPFETAWWLGEDDAAPSGLREDGLGRRMDSMAAALPRAPDRRRALADYALHGHTGFAWAAHRAFVERHGLYDRAIIGGGDLILAHAFAADEDFLRGRNYYARDLAPKERAAIGSWGREVARETRGRIGRVAGGVRHLFHGDTAARRYLERMRILRDADFDPDRDIAAGDDGAWRWASDKPDLHRRVREYFASRTPDGARAPTGGRA